MDAPYPSHPLPIGAAFARQARLTPDRTAVRGDDGELTYGELDDRSDRLARHLQDLGVIVGDVVALDAGRSVAAVVGLLGVLKAGAAYLALERRYPPERRPADPRGRGRPVRPHRARRVRGVASRVHGPAARSGPARAGTRRPRGDPRRLRLPRLHLGVDRRAEGRLRPAPRRVAPRARRRLPRHHRGRRVPAVRADGLRRVHPGDLGPAPQRRAPGPRPRPRPVRQRTHQAGTALGRDRPLADRRPLPAGRRVRSRRPARAARPARRMGTSCRRPT